MAHPTFKLLMGVNYLFMPFVILTLQLKMSLYLLSFLLVSFQWGNWLIIIMMFNFLMMVVLCKITCQEKYLQRGLKFDIYFLWLVPHLGHPHSVVLSHLINSGSFCTKYQCKLEERKSLSFLT